MVKQYLGAYGWHSCKIESQVSLGPVTVTNIFKLYHFDTLHFKNALTLEDHHLFKGIRRTIFDYHQSLSAINSS